jgi:hypothetical protein
VTSDVDPAFLHRDDRFRRRRLLVPRGDAGRANVDVTDAAATEAATHEAFRHRGATDVAGADKEDRAHRTEV